MRPAWCRSAAGARGRSSRSPRARSVALGGVTVVAGAPGVVVPGNGAAWLTSMDAVADAVGALPLPDPPPTAATSNMTTIVTAAPIPSARYRSSREPRLPRPRRHRAVTLTLPLSGTARSTSVHAAYRRAHRGADDHVARALLRPRLRRRHPRDEHRGVAPAPARASGVGGRGLRLGVVGLAPHHDVHEPVPHPRHDAPSARARADVPRDPRGDGGARRRRPRRCVSLGHVCRARRHRGDHVRATCIARTTVPRGTR